MNKTKTRENRNGKGQPRNARAAKNWSSNEAFRAVKEANGGKGQREIRREMTRKSRQRFIDSLKPAAETE